MKSGLKKLVILTALFAPFIALAQNIQNIIGTIGALIGLVLPILMGIAVIVFVWGVIRFILAGGDEEKRKSARDLITYGIIGLFVLVAVWGIVNVISRTFLGGTDFPVPQGPAVPQVPSGATPLFTPDRGL